MSPNKKRKPVAEFPGGYKQAATTFEVGNLSFSTAASSKDEAAAAASSKDEAAAADSFLVELVVFEFMWGS